ncbi:MAG: acylneuraminate cytidylyltransferase family protein, partial [Deltaproteobacteria bacterium]|nr:acylneuraminate cytidylyltransferase family protein [Deltaproteobacteria bacterium]
RIPARGGSRRVPRKNVRDLCGRPALAWTVDAALESGLFALVVVSTDSEEIALAARAAGAEVPFLREAALADDRTPSSLVTLDALQRLDPEGTGFVRVCQLMPNCPLRTAQDIGAGYRMLLESRAEAVLSVCGFGWCNPWWAMKAGADGALDPLHPEALSVRSQDLPDLVAPTGAVWWATAAALRTHRTFYAPDRRGVRIPFVNGLDIDTWDDWRLAEALLSARRDRR